MRAAQSNFMVPRGMYILALRKHLAVPEGGATFAVTLRRSATPEVLSVPMSPA